MAVVGRRTQAPKLSMVAYLTALYIPTLLLRSNVPFSFGPTSSCCVYVRRTLRLSDFMIHATWRLAANLPFGTRILMIPRFRT